MMNNVFANADNLHHVFDIKGCTAGRFVANPQRSLERAATRKGIPRALATKETLKDGNFDCDLYLSRSSRNLFLKQLRSDGEFLKRCNIMDYSLLLGVCVRHDQEEEEKKKENVLQGSMRARLIPRHTQARYRKGGMEHIDERVFREGTDLYSGSVQCYFGVIDILQQYVVLCHECQSYHSFLCHMKKKITRTATLKHALEHTGTT